MYQIIRKHIFRRFKKTETKIHELNYLFWECTTRCNLSCLHCGSDCSKDNSIGDMPLGDFLTALDTIKSKSEKFIVVLTGGEPLLRNDIEICGREIRSRGVRWSMVTNGYLYNEQKHISLLNAGLGALTISLDGLENTHNWLRNKKDSFSKVDRAIDLAASSSRLNFDVVTCVNSRNWHELPALYDYLIQKKVKAWRLFTIVPIGRAKDNPELFLTDLQFRELMDFISEKRKLKLLDVKFSCEGYVGSYESKVRDQPFFCRAGINIGSILIDGSISACPNIDQSLAQGNIYQDNFAEIWETNYQAFRDRSWTKRGQCAECADYTDCQGNGLHNWHGNKENVLICHKGKIERATKSNSYL
ncbi:MAG: TIGR04133 family radical SAM/SPASM protein [Prolixibacteraceae bacterium]|nr:TIGR04133 family radical SAM/SPASM protein [Prolixibacteraceae bacterium]